MKKTLLATAVAASMAATGVQAANVYDQNGTTLGVDGRIAMAMFGGSENPSAEFKDFGSRLGLSMSNQISNDLRAFGRVEWRFTGDERDTSSGFSEVRHSFIGLESNSMGTLQFGNFDGYYGSHVTSTFDVYLHSGFLLTGAGNQDRGDSIGYITPDLDGFKVFIQAKHYPTNPTANDPSSKIATQGGASYEQGPFKVALGYIDNIQRGGGTGEVIIGGTGSYAVNDAVSVRLGAETENDVQDKLGAGLTYSIDQWAFNADIYNISPDVGDSRTAWATGAYYAVSSNFNVFAELFQDDQQSVTIDSDGITSESTDIQYVTGVRYMF